MAIHLTAEILKNIAGELDCGMTCFYHIKTGEVKSYPDQAQFSDYDFDDWDDLIEEIDDNIDEYIRFDVMKSHESFQIMADFVEDIRDTRTRNKFIDALEKRKPFQQFKGLLHYYPALLEEWYRYKQQRFIEYVEEIVEAHNLADNFPTD